MSFSSTWKSSILAIIVIAGVIGYFLFSNSQPAWQTPELRKQKAEIKKILKSANRIKTSDGWFEVIKLPNKVYAFYEPGHNEKMNSFLVIGSQKDLLYDTGMGIANIKNAIQEVRKKESLPEHDLIVVNSHSHLDHKGGNSLFKTIYVYDSQWTREKQTTKLTPGKWQAYYAMLSGKPKAPKGYDPKTFTYPATKKSQLKFLNEGSVIDLGDRKFIVYLTKSHTPDSIVLYDAKNKVLFSGDAIGPNGFLVRDMDLLALDIETFNEFDVDYHYNTHGEQLIPPATRKMAAHAIALYQQGKFRKRSAHFADNKISVYTAGGMEFGFAPCLMMEA